MTNTPTFMNGFRFFMLGLDFPPRTAIGYLWIVTEDTPEKENKGIKYLQIPDS